MNPRTQGAALVAMHIIQGALFLVAFIYLVFAIILQNWNFTEYDIATRALLVITELAAVVVYLLFYKNSLTEDIAIFLRQREDAFKMLCDVNRDLRIAQDVHKKYAKWEIGGKPTQISVLYSKNNGFCIGSYVHKGTVSYWSEEAQPVFLNHSEILEGNRYLTEGYWLRGPKGEFVEPIPEHSVYLVIPELDAVQKMGLISNKTEKVIISDNTVLCVGDSCTTHWKGNGEMILLSFHWDYDQPLKVIRLRDSVEFYMHPLDLVAYTNNYDTANKKT